MGIPVFIIQVLDWQILKNHRILKGKAVMVAQQKTLAPKGVKYSTGPYNVIKGDTQRIRITEGCPHNHAFCYEPREIKVFSIPDLATIHPESNCYVVRGISRGLSGVQRISVSRVGGRFLSYVWGMRL